MPSPMAPSVRWSASTSSPTSWSRRSGPRCRGRRAGRSGSTASTAAGGTCNLFLAFEPLAGWRRVEVTERRTAADFAHRMRCGRWSTTLPRGRTDRGGARQPGHAQPGGPLSDASPRGGAPAPPAARVPLHARARQLAEHGRAGVLRARSPVLNQRLPDREALRRAIGAWQADRNAARAKVRWRFTVTAARIKLHRLYPA